MVWCDRRLSFRETLWKERRRGEVLGKGWSNTTLESPFFKSKKVININPQNSLVNCDSSLTLIQIRRFLVHTKFSVLQVLLLIKTYKHRETENVR